MPMLAGGVQGRGADGTLKGHAHVEDRTLHAVKQTGRAARNRAGLLGQRRAWSAHRDGLAPRLYWPSGRPQAIMLSAIKITRSAPKVLKVNRTIAG